MANKTTVKNIKTGILYAVSADDLKTLTDRGLMGEVYLVVSPEATTEVKEKLSAQKPKSTESDINE